ncbi:MAG TPA: hypothetical protein DCF61_10970, partial [Alphaproteobacteria bacterium]|nr:hypothetical protein [Alphaproteobacteria bacterium]
MAMKGTGAAALTIMLAVCAGGLPAQAQSDAGGDREFITFQVENDLFANFTNTDRHYTNGLQ